MKSHFRVWDIKNKLMLNLRLINFEESYVETCDGDWYRFDEVVLIQSTGLRDKDSVEIYEGDILSRKTHVWMYGSDLNEWVTETYPVVWQDGGWYLNEEPLAFILEEGVYRDGFRKTALQVIGNIHEDRELLEVAE